MRAKKPCEVESAEVPTNADGQSKTERLFDEAIKLSVFFGFLITSFVWSGSAGPSLSMAGIVLLQIMVLVDVAMNGSWHRIVRIGQGFWLCLVGGIGSAVAINLLVRGDEALSEDMLIPLMITLGMALCGVIILAGRFKQE